MPPPTDAIATIRAYLETSGLEWEESPPSTFVITLPGERKLRTTVALVVGAQSVTVNAFVARHPDEAHEAVYRWLLERNRRMYGVCFAIDQLGDISTLADPSVVQHLIDTHRGMQAA